MTSSLRVPVDKNDHYLGPLHAPVILVEYGDYECPYSAVLAPAIEKLVHEFKTNLCVVYRHYPMKVIHPMAHYAAISAEAAERQGQFWQMHKLLFKNYDSLSMEKIDELARKLGMNMNLFYQDMEREDLKEKLEMDIMGGIQSEVNSTPSIYINDLQYEGSSTYEPLRETIQKTLEGGESAYL